MKSTKLPTCRVIQTEIDQSSFSANKDHITAELAKAASDKIDLVIFPQGTLTGLVPPECDSFIYEAEALLSEITLPENISAIFSLRPNSLFTQTIFVENGQIIEKSDDPAFIAHSERFGDILVLVPTEIDNDYLIPLASEVVEEATPRFIIVTDIHHVNNSFTEDISYLLDELSTRFEVPIIYSNYLGISDANKSLYAYPGFALAISKQGGIIGAIPPFKEAELTISLGSKKTLGEFEPPEINTSFIVQTMRYAITKFLSNIGIKRIVIGLSGGIDSAVTAALYGSILPPEDILLVSMPGPFTSNTTRKLAHTLANNLGARYAEMPITESVNLTKNEFQSLITQGPNSAKAGAWELSSYVLENVQARDRGSRILSAAAAVFRGVISCNGNKDELTIGYGTMYGDIIGYLAPLGDLWKGQVYEVGRYLNQSIYKREIIPSDIFTIKPSAELSEAQDVTRGLGDPLNYPYHDKLFRSWVEDSTSPEEILEWYISGDLATSIGYEGDIKALFKTPQAFISDLERFWNLYQGLAIAKRLQAPPILVLSNSPLSAKLEKQGKPFYSRKYLALKATLL